MASVVISGDTSGSVTLSAPAVAGTTTLTLPSTSGTVLTTASTTGISGSAISTGTVAEAYGGTGTSTGYYGFKNRIINGAMGIWQRGTSATGANAYCCVDRFDFSRNTIVWDAAQSTDVPSTTNFRYSTSVTVTTNSSAAGAYAYIYQAIEGYNWADLGYGTASAQTSTLSFWVKSSLTGTFGIALRNATGSSRFFTTTYTINSANTWEQKTITITGDTAGTWNTTNGVGLAIFWDLGVGSTYSSTSNNAWSTVASNFFGVTAATKLGATNGATFYITGVQLEKGSTATSFDYRPYGTELFLCQRYLEKSSDDASSGLSGQYAIGNGGVTTGAILVPVYFSVPKRTSPTVTIYDGNSGTANQITRTTPGVGSQGGQTASVQGINTRVVQVYSGSGNSHSGIAFYWKAEAEL